ncbi:MAG: hypothetical protein K2X01_11310 [Cyanobacteria bacterium]|nr:hypothetical protein [Cyanobacteriota bacterium]
MIYIASLHDERMGHRFKSFLKQHSTLGSPMAAGICPDTITLSIDSAKSSSLAVLGSYSSLDLHIQYILKNKQALVFWQKISISLVKRTLHFKK